MKTHRIEIRVTEREKVEVERAARWRKQTVSEYLRVLHEEFSIEMAWLKRKG